MEDAISGLTAGRAAGALTLAVCTSTEKIRLVENGKPDFIVNDLTKYESISTVSEMFTHILQSFGGFRRRKDSRHYQTVAFVDYYVSIKLLDNRYGP